MTTHLRGATAQERARYASLVRPARLHRGMSQQELATIASVDRTTVSNIERGAGAPQADVLRRLFRALGLITDPHDDLEADLWVAMIESLLLSVPRASRDAAANAALAAIATHVGGEATSALAATIPRIGQMREERDGHDAAAKRGDLRRRGLHAD